MSFDPYDEWLGIPPDQQPPSHYLLLGLEPGESDPQKIRVAADTLLKSIREVAKDEHAQAARQIFTHVKTARSCLLDEAQKREYDKQLFGHDAPLPFDEPAELEDLKKARSSRKSRPGIGLILGFLMGPITVAVVYFFVIKPGNKPPEPDPRPESNLVSQSESQLQRKRTPSDDNRRRTISGTPQKNPTGRQDDTSTDQQQRESNSDPGNTGLPTQFGNLTGETTQTEKETPRDDPKPAPKPVPRVPRPPEDQLESARKTLLDLFQKRISEAKDLDANKALANELIGLSKAGSPADAEKFAILELAIELATRGGAIELTDEAISRLCTAFELSDLPYRARAVKDWAAMISKDYRGDEKSARQAFLAIIATSLAEEAGRRNENEMATEMFKLASTQAGYSGDKDRSRELLRLAQNFERLARVLKEAQPQIDAALADPENPEKNDVAAGILCFELNDWDAGLPFLSRGSDETLKQLAERDLNQTQDVSERIQLADDWWTASNDVNRDRKPAIQRRAVGIYESVFEQLPGLKRVLAISRMKETGPVTLSLPSPRIHFNFEPSSIEPNGRTLILENQMGKIGQAELVGLLTDAGRTGSAFLLNGVDCYANCPSTTHVIDAEEKFTLSVWIQPVERKEQDIAGKFESARYSSNLDFGLALDENNIPFGQVATANQSTVLEARGTDPVLQSDWTHLALTWDRYNLKLYVNGELAGSSVRSSRQPLILRTKYNFCVGGMNRSATRSSSHRFAGAIDELRLMARKLEPVEVMYLYLQDRP